MQKRSREVVITAEIKAWLPSAAFPADGDMLADEAQVRGGPRDLVAMLRRLPTGRVYQSLGQAVRELRALRHVYLSSDPERVTPRVRRRLDPAQRAMGSQRGSGGSLT